MGLSRTGTASVANALRQLGVPTHHYSPEAFVRQDTISPSLKFEPQAKRSVCRKWRLQKEINAKLQLDKINFSNSVRDFPIPLFYRELRGKYPDARFIYTFRDEQKWLTSMCWLYTDGAVIWKHGLLDDEIKYRAITHGIMTKRNC